MLDKKLNACCYSNKVKNKKMSGIQKHKKSKKPKKNTKIFEQTCDLKLISNDIWRKHAKILYQMNYSAA